MTHGIVSVNNIATKPPGSRTKYTRIATQDKGPDGGYGWSRVHDLRKGDGTWNAGKYEYDKISHVSTDQNRLVCLLWSR
jgi:hypothetical protein